MSRTIKQIYEQAIKERNTRLELSEFDSDSKLSILNGITWTFAAVIFSFESILDVFGIIQRAAKELGFELPEKDFPADLLDKHYYWSMQQIAVSGIGSIDYRRIFDASETKAKVKGKASWMELRSAMDSDNEGKRIVVCATVTEVEEKSYKDKTSGEKKKFAKLTLQQNNDLMELVCWSDFLNEFKGNITSLKDKVIVVSAIIKYSDYTGANSLNTHKTSIMEQM